MESRRPRGLLVAPGLKRLPPSPAEAVAALALWNLAAHHRRGGPQVSTLGHPAAALATLAAAGCPGQKVLKKSGNFLARQLYNLQTNQTRADHWQAKIKS